ncbi:terpene synthase family protein [Aspergillus candidus]|uniref:Isoprenoid synthase domain-containing protein n=1 Tax=Aspergillus candidus TaxID=41067 RepID=A0A2I2FLX1_ASPCN|nr:isoprenoid synthase domain-containing protein [Aspergillus candidus]PLB41613.1 isoprenoid synthase domain-containing protein [Aspergillus candidus]
MDGQECGENGRSEHAIDIFPSQAGLPWATAISSCRQSKYWQVTVDTARVFLSLFAADESSQQIFKSRHSIAEIARAELANNMEEGWVKFPVYLFSEGDKQRTRLLAVVNVFIFIFDDFWEMHNIDYFSEVKSLFVDRMRPGYQPNEQTRTPLQLLIDNAMNEIRSLDCGAGNNAGEEMIDLMVRFFERPPPPKDFPNMEDFLLYRHEDAAVPYVLGCTKFALNSSVDLNSPRLEKYLRLLKDHVSVANDLGSWAKEKKAYDTGKVIYMINAVDVVKALLCLPTDESAVAMTQAFQLQIEIGMDAEIQRLRAEESLTLEEWRFIDATLHVASGNVFVSTVMSRYGGEEFRLY